MSVLNNINMKPKLIGLFLIVGLIPILIIAGFSLYNASQSLQEAGYNALEGTRIVKQNWIIDYFNKSQSDMHAVADSVIALRQATLKELYSIQTNKQQQLADYFNEQHVNIQSLKHVATPTQALIAFRTALEAEKTPGGTRWLAAESQFGPTLNNIAANWQYKDILLINDNGLIVYSLNETGIIGTSLLDGKLQDSNLAAAYRAVLSGQDVAIADFQPYTSLNKAFAGYAVGALRDTNNNRIGLIAMEMPTDRLNSIAQDRTGLGASGETYFAAKESDNRIVFRSTMLTMGDGKYVQGYDLTSIAPQYLQEALNGQKGQGMYIDSEGKSVLVVYRPLALEGMNWAIVTKIDVVETLAPSTGTNDTDLFTAYQKQYGYGDMLLITANGDIVHTSNKDDEYTTNILTGEYKETNLADAVKAALQNKAFAFADFVPYPPADNKPVAFMAQPLIADGLVEGVVVAQLPVEKINQIMQATAGNNQTQIAYLVGNDNRMRSDIPGDNSHSIEASFKGNVAANGISNEAVTAALTGQANHLIQTNYAGKEVLTAYSPVVLFDGTNNKTTWAILVDVETGEVNKPVITLMGYIGGIGILIALFVIGLALYVATNIANPIQRITAVARAIASGDLTQEVTFHQRDEIGELADAFRRLSASLRVILSNIQETASSLNAASAEILAATTQQASGASEQSAAVTQTTTTVDEVRVISEQAINRSQEVAVSAKRTVEVSRSGRQSIEGIVGSMNQIKTRVEHIAQNILALSDKTQQIGAIITTVNDIASQSNMLALNASVEAARAGEHGKGFAVVATEVRNLAEQSRQATSQVRAILTDIQNAINASVMVTEEGVKVVEDGVGRAGDAREAIEQLASVITESAQIAGQVAAGGQQQASGVEQIALAIQNINQAMQQNLASTRQAENAARSLNQMANSLNETVKQYKINGRN